MVTSIVNISKNNYFYLYRHKNIKNMMFCGKTPLNKLDLKNCNIRKSDLVTGGVLDLEGIRKIEKAGIKTVIALPGAQIEKYKNLVKDSGLNYKQFFEDIIDEEDFYSFVDKKTQNKVVQEMRNFFDTINNKNGEAPFYMGCKEGVKRTGLVCTLDYVFNSSAREQVNPLKFSTSSSKKIIKNFATVLKYKFIPNLTEENKQLLKITEENENKIMTKLENILEF